MFKYKLTGIITDCDGETSLYHYVSEEKEIYVDCPKLQNIHTNNSKVTVYFTTPKFIESYLNTSDSDSNYDVYTIPEDEMEIMSSDIVIDKWEDGS